MGGAGYIFTGENDIAIMHNSAQINLNVVAAAQKSTTLQKILYTSSACIYPDHIQTDPNSSLLKSKMLIQLLLIVSMVGKSCFLSVFIRP